MTHLGYLCCKQNLEKLKKINLSYSRKLTDILMLSEALFLEHIDLEGCVSLSDVSTSISHLGKLVSLNMKDCSRLRSLPSMINLISLKLLTLTGCSKLEDIKDFAPNLEELHLAGSAIDLESHPTWYAKSGELQKASATANWNI